MLVWFQQSGEFSQTSFISFHSSAALGSGPLLRMFFHIGSSRGCPSSFLPYIFKQESYCLFWMKLEFFSATFYQNKCSIPFLLFVYYLLSLPCIYQKFEYPWWSPQNKYLVENVLESTELCISLPWVEKSLDWKWPGSWFQLHVPNNLLGCRAGQQGHEPCWCRRRVLWRVHSLRQLPSGKNCIGLIQQD